VFYILFVDTRLLNKCLIIFNMNEVLLYVIHKTSLQNKPLPRNLDIETTTKIYFICLGFRELFEQCPSYFLGWFMVIYTTKELNEFFPFLFDKIGLKMEQFKVMLIQDDCDTISKKGYVGVWNPHLYHKP